MCTKIILLTGSLLCAFLLGACNYPLSEKPQPASGKTLPDTLRLGDFRYRLDNLQRYDLLSDSLSAYYKSRAGEGAMGGMNAEINYTLYAEQAYFLEENSWGRLVLFKPEYNAYCSLQLYVENPKGRIQSAVEVAYFFGEEGSLGDGSSILLQQAEQIIIYKKAYWEMFYGSEAERHIPIDSIMAYTINENEIRPLPLSEQKAKAIRALFERRY